MKLKKLLWFLLCVHIVLMTPTYVLALDPMDEFYVNDYVGALSSSQREDMLRRANDLRAGNGVEVVAVIVDNFYGASMDDYATTVFNDFKIGSKADNNGVLLIVAVEDGEVVIRLGTGMEGLISDSRTGRIIDEYFMGPAREDRIGDAVYDTYMQLIRESSRSETSGRAANTTGTGNSPARSNATANSGGGGLGGGFVLVVIMIILFCVIVNARGMRRRRRWFPMFPPLFRGRRYHRRSSPTIIVTPPMRPNHRGNSGFGGGRTLGGGGRTSGGGASRSFGGSSSFGGGRSSGGKTSGGGGRTSGGGAGRSFKK